MQKRALIIHGWEGFPEEGWFPWLKTELENRGFEVLVSQMPNPDAPRIDTWLEQISKVYGELGEHDLLIGHSIGCQAILRYLSEIKTQNHVAGVISVAGFFYLVPLPVLDQTIFESWLNTPMDYEKIKAHADKVIALFSDNDRWVPLENAELFQERLQAETIILPNRGHFSGYELTFEIPELLTQIDKIE